VNAKTQKSPLTKTVSAKTTSQVKVDGLPEMCLVLKQIKYSYTVTIQIPDSQVFKWSFSDTIFLVFQWYGSHLVFNHSKTNHLKTGQMCPF
jgi:hypothetical protein